jgi:hypothetical protein
MEHGAFRRAGRAVQMVFHSGRYCIVFGQAITFESLRVIWRSPQFLIKIGTSHKYFSFSKDFSSMLKISPRSTP